MPYDNPVTVHCSNCGSEDVRAEAYAEWNPELQMWELASIRDERLCETCGHGVTTYERALTHHHENRARRT